MPQPDPAPIAQRRPETTCAYRRKQARKDHRCSACEARIVRGTLYVQDDYYAPFGDGRRYCLACAKANESAEAEWMQMMDNREAREIAKRYPDPHGSSCDG